MLGAFVDTVGGPALPINVQLWLVARLVQEEGDDVEGVDHIVVLVESVGGESVCRLEAQATRTRPPLSGPVDPDMPQGGLMVVPLPMSFPRSGLYSVSLAVNGQQLWLAPLRAKGPDSE